jgi:hypothetical protein
VAFSNYLILKPSFISSLNHFVTSHDGSYGKIISKWERSGENLVCTVSVLPNSAASLILNSGLILEPERIAKTEGAKSVKSSELLTKISVEPGFYTFKIR